MKMQKLGNLDKWPLVKNGEGIEFSVERRVRLEVLSPVGTDWYFMEGKKKGQYFTTTSGREVLEFVAVEGMRVMPTKHVRYYSSENEHIHVDETGNPVFTRIANRQARNPEMEMVAAIAAENATRRMQQMYAEDMRRKDEQINQLKGEVVDRETGEIIDQGTASATASSADGRTKESAVTPTEKADPRATPTGSEEGKEAGGELSDSHARTDG
jgi:hypothetical protein